MGPNTQQYGYYGEPKRGGFNPKIIAIILGGLILVGLAITGITIVSNRNDIGPQTQHLSARLTNLLKLTTNSSKQLQTGDLQKINAEAGLITVGVQTDLAGILPKQADKSVVTTESDATDTTQLAAAALAGTYDREYKTVLTGKLQSITALFTEMYTKSTSKTTKALLDNDYKKYQSILDSLEKTDV